MSGGAMKDDGEVVGQPRVAIVGGGLAGLAAAAGLAGRGLQIELCEARRMLGGRATSFRDPASGELVDHCQHVSMGCCTNLADFCRRTGIAAAFRRDRTLHFFGPDGRRYDLAASRWLPAPLHLAPSFLRLGYLTLGERLAIGRTMLALARMPVADDANLPTIGVWLRGQGQSENALERFWAVVLVSALGETLDRASLAQARKVFVDGFLAAREAYEIEVPQITLGELYGERLERWLTEQGIAVRLGTAVERVDADGSRPSLLIQCEGNMSEPYDAVIVALPWRRVGDLFAKSHLQESLPGLKNLDQIESAPITGVHLWFDRPITPLPHAVLVGTLSQWVFNRGDASEGKDDLPSHYYQVVISASRQLAGRTRDDIVAEVLAELKALWPAAREAELLRSRIVSEQNAVFSVRPGLDELRMPQQTAIPRLALAGDWTRTGWPATMEGAVRSGYLAAESILAELDRPAQLLVPDLKRAFLSRWLLGQSSDDHSVAGLAPSARSSP
jgi:squalene-associated FAD-dependent desaturase